MMTDSLIDRARLIFVQARGRGIDDETAAAYADGLLARANPLELRRELLTQQITDLQGCVRWAIERKLWTAAREYRHQIARANEELALIEHMAANVQAAAAQ